MVLIKQKLFLPLALLVITLLSWFVQSTLFLKGDVSWLLHLARLVLAGGDYGKDFFEINPPLIIFLYVPAVLLSSVFTLSNIVAIRLYVFLLVFISLAVSSLFIKKIFLREDRLLASVFFLTLAFDLLMLPLSEFGQREHLLMILTLPYILLMICRLQNKSITPSLALGVGLMAGLGFAIKPFFLLAFVSLELYYLINTRKLLSAFRIETFAIALMAFAHLVIAALFYKSYFTLVVPLAVRFYYKNFGWSLQHVILQPIVIFCFYTCAFALLEYRQTIYKKLIAVFMIEFFSYFLVFVLQQIPWYYHLLPMFAMAIVLLVFSFTLFFKQPARSRHQVYLLGGFFVLLIDFLNYSYDPTVGNWYLYYYLAASVIMLVAYLFYYTRSRLFLKMASLFLGILMFCFPAYFISNFYINGIEQKRQLTTVVDYLHTHEQNKPVYFFSAITAYMVSVFEQAGVENNSRLQFLSWMRCYFNEDGLKTDKQPCLLKASDESFFIDMLAEDLNKNKPVIIFVDSKEYHSNQGLQALNYVQILMKNPQFRSAWLPYHYLTTLQNPAQDFKFDVYSRN